MLTTVGRKIVLMTLIATFLGGCRENVDDKPQNESVLQVSELLGSWVRTTEYGTTTVNFNADGTFTQASEDEEYDAVETSTWAVEGIILELAFRGEVEGEMEAYSEALTASILDDRLLWGGVMVRTGGDGEGLDGTWEESEVETYEWREESSAGWGRFVARETFTISGDRFTLVEEVGEEGEEEGYTYSYVEIIEGRGVLRIDGNRLYYTVTENNGEPLLEEYREEHFLGYRIAPNVIRTQLFEDSDPFSGAYERR